MVGLEHLEGESVTVICERLEGYPDIIVRPCAPADLSVLDDGVPEDLLAPVAGAADVICNEFAWTGLIGGRPVICCGLIVHWRGRDESGRRCGYAEAWARIASVPRRAWPAITRRCAAELERAAADGIRLIEATVDLGFAPGQRWAARLGFRVACPRPGWGVTGNDGILYQRHRGPG